MRQETSTDGSKISSESMVRLVFAPSGSILVAMNIGLSSMGTPLMYQSVEMFMPNIVSVMRQ